jgi:hypothetical protein
MPSDQTKPLLRLTVSAPTERVKGAPDRRQKPSGYSVAAQNAEFGPRFQRLASILNGSSAGLALKNDPAAMAPERLLVFELRGMVSAFARAIQKVEGLELIDEEELDGDDKDEAPALYLLVPDARALSQILSLWQSWVRKEAIPRGFTPWRDVFATLRDIRPWGPQDRVSREEQQILAEELAHAHEGDRIRVEIELVFRKDSDAAQRVESEVANAIAATDGRLISRCRIENISYHALLADLPVRAVEAIAERSPAGFASLDPIMYIRPQSIASRIDAGDITQGAPVPEVGERRPPILALLDGVPVARHPLLADALTVDDPFGLEPVAVVANRHHGTAMASLIVHGDRNVAQPALTRRIVSIPVLGNNDEFPPDRLIVDMIYQAVLRLKTSAEFADVEIVIVNLSLGNLRQPFHGRLSAWARLLDDLAYRHGILFVVSAGNHTGPIEVPDYADFSSFERALPDAKAESIYEALGRIVADRRLLAPADSVNSITVGASNQDAVSARRTPHADPFSGMVTANLSSALGPGFANSVKPDVLSPGSREHLAFVSSGATLTLRPSGATRAHGLKVAAPSTSGIANDEHYTCGTSAAAALVSRTSHLIYDALESTYGAQFTALSSAHKAVLIKALIVHSSAWPERAADTIRSVLGPFGKGSESPQKDNIRRFLGYGVVDSENAVACAEDRATFWASGEIGRDKLVSVDVPIPFCINGLAQPHSLTATLAWLTPVLPGRRSYRAVRMRVVEPDDLNLDPFNVTGSGNQPNQNQVKRGTAYSRRWEGNRAPLIGSSQAIRLSVQREPDSGGPVDELIPFALAVTVTMPGVTQIYDECRVRLAPRVVAPAPRVRP